MSIFSPIRKRLGLKLLFSYLLVILTAVVILGISLEFVIPSVFDRHMGFMAETGMMEMHPPGTPGTMMMDLFDSFRSAVNEAMIRAGIAAFIVALVVSILISRKVVAPVQAMTAATQSIAEGHYEQRVEVRGSQREGDELTQLAVRFNQMASTLHQTELLRRQLIGDVSHELRTPLTTIKGSLEGLIDGVLPPTPETFQNILHETNRLQRLAADLQELSRVEAGEISLELETRDLVPIVEAVVERLRPQFDDKGIGLDLQLPAALPLVRLDADRISQVLVNLLGNALQYTPTGGQVTLRGTAIGANIEVQVQDTGIGIPPEHLPHLFTRFYRVDKSRSRPGGGSGIGLTIAKHLVEAHGGQIRAESGGTNQGSTFSFTLPIAKGA